MKHLQRLMFKLKKHYHFLSTCAIKFRFVKHQFSEGFSILIYIKKKLYNKTEKEIFYIFYHS